MFLKSILVRDACRQDPADLSGVCSDRGADHTAGGRPGDRQILSMRSVICYAVISTAGFGDIVVTTFAAKVVSVLLTAYSIVVIALVTGVIVNYYNQLTV